LEDGMTIGEKITSWLLRQWGNLTGLPLPVGPSGENTATFKLGRKAVKRDSRTLRIGNYLRPTLPPPPAVADWTKSQTDWGMLLNDMLGDCTIAGAMHAVMGWSLNAGRPLRFIDADALEYYKRFCNYDPKDPSTDAGGILLDVLNDWRKQGINGHKVTAFASVRPMNVTEVKQALVLFGPLYCGLDFPQSAIGQKQWELTRDRAIAGGHCVVMIGYNEIGPVFISWGGVYQATWEFYNYYFATLSDGEIYVAISPDWFSDLGVNPSGLNLNQLQADLAAIR